MPIGAERRKQQSLAIALALFEGKTDVEVAKAAGVSVRTVANRKGTDEVQTELQRLRFEQAEAVVEAVTVSARDAAGAAAATALANLGSVLDGILAIAKDVSNPPNHRRQAYKDYADIIFKMFPPKTTQFGAGGEDSDWEPLGEGGHMSLRRRVSKPDA